MPQAKRNIEKFKISKPVGNPLRNTTNSVESLTLSNGSIIIANTPQEDSIESFEKYNGRKKNINMMHEKYSSESLNKILEDPNIMKTSDVENRFYEVSDETQRTFMDQRKDELKQNIEFIKKNMSSKVIEVNIKKMDKKEEKNYKIHNGLGIDLEDPEVEL